MRRFAVWPLVAALAAGACAADGPAAPSPDASARSATTAVEEPVDGTSASYEERGEPLRIVTLGDAYTRGTDTAAPRRDSWPSQLVESLERSGLSLWLWNLAEPSHTSSQLIEEQLGQVASLEPDVVTLQVGVNDIIAHETDWYHDNVEIILDELLAILGPDRIFAVTTPDHTLTEWGDAFGPREDGSVAVAELNATLAEVAAARDIEVVDIGQVNDLALADRSLVVGDGPYPTAKQYAGWVEVIGPRVYQALVAIGR